ncbi:alpha/beta-Hydrolases superfamily protein [Actinidia rufa]|uniref:Alpha/beta-Hydrolases superfamily protein n=1 Tax=Actinidia rufa TaxID=165716 RepID=A0A7J0FJ99_9ERIC|nr:alpha/beta-Hydrolases superfamily protein [Actinidia rufa]
MSGPQCCENPPALTSSCGGSGSVVELGGLKAYTTGPSDSKLAIVLISDVYGYEPPNLRKLADKVAASGYYVVVPDFFYGEPYAPDNTDRPLPIWIQSHGTDKGFEDAKPVIAALKNKGISAIGAAGFCWGAKVVVELAKSDYIQAAVLLHPSLVTVDDIKDALIQVLIGSGVDVGWNGTYVMGSSKWGGREPLGWLGGRWEEVKAPLAVLGAETDRISPPELLKQFEEVLSVRPEIHGYVKIFPGVVHGWTVRYNVEDEKAVKCAEEAHQNMLDWFLEHVK